MGNKGENIGDGGGWSRRFGRTMPHIRSAASGQNPQRPGVRNLGDLARIGGQIKGFLIWFCSFWDFTLAFWKSPFSHFLFASLCVPCCIVAVLCDQQQRALKMSHLIHQCALTIEMCGREERVRRKREDTNKSRTKNFPGRTQKGGDWTPPWTSYYGVVRAIRRTGCCRQNGWWSNGEGGLPAINCCHNWSPTLTTGFSNAGKFYIYWCSHFLSLTRSSCWSGNGSFRYNRKLLIMFVWI